MVISARKRTKEGNGMKRDGGICTLDLSGQERP